MAKPKRLADITQDAVERAGRRAPLEIWEGLVRSGLIDETGRVLEPRSPSSARPSSRPARPARRARA